MFNTFFDNLEKANLKKKIVKCTTGWKFEMTSVEQIISSTENPEPEGPATKDQKEQVRMKS
jgi:hypothetical protein